MIAVAGIRASSMASPQPTQISRKHKLDLLRDKVKVRNKMAGVVRNSKSGVEAERDSDGTYPDGASA